MDKKYLVFGVIFLAVVFSVWTVFFGKSKNTPSNLPAMFPSAEITSPESAAPPVEEKNTTQEQEADFLSPLARAKERVTKKPFGIFITPQNSPVSPERFTGYHTAADFEIFPGEENADVPVKAVCSGNILMKKSATGYGGVAVESCNLNNEPITVIYGHLKLSSINYNIGDKINAGDTLGILGQGYSAETSGERKHLHLGFRKGASINILGYVQDQAELSGWMDPCLYVCQL